MQYKELKLGGHSGHAKTNLSGHCVKMTGHCFLKVTPILIWYNVSLASQPLFFFFLVKGVEKKKRLETLARFLWAVGMQLPEFPPPPPPPFCDFADVCSQLLLANRTRTSSEASPALLLSLLDSHIRSMMS